MKEQFLVGLTSGAKKKGKHTKRLSDLSRGQSLGRITAEDLGMFIFSKKSTGGSNLFATIDPNRQNSVSPPLNLTKSLGKSTHHQTSTIGDPTINHVDHESVDVSSRESSGEKTNNTKVNE